MADVSFLFLYDAKLKFFFGEVSAYSRYYNCFPSVVKNYAVLVNTHWYIKIGIIFFYDNIQQWLSPVLL
jgi:hypothetical protein